MQAFRHIPLCSSLVPIKRAKRKFPASVIPPAVPPKFSLVCKSSSSGKPDSGATLSLSELVALRFQTSFAVCHSIFEAFSLSRIPMPLHPCIDVSKPCVSLSRFSHDYVRNGTSVPFAHECSPAPSEQSSLECDLAETRNDPIVSATRNVVQQFQQISEAS